MRPSERSAYGSGIIGRQPGLRLTRTARREPCRADAGAFRAVCLAAIRGGLGQSRSARAIPYRSLAAISLAALVLRIAPMVRQGTSWARTNPDSAQYVELAQGLRSGCGYARLVNGACLSPEVLRLPGYPSFLASMPSIRIALGVTAVLSSLVCMIAGLFAARMWGGRAGMLAALLIAFDVPSAIAATQVMSDSLFQSLVVTGVLAETCLIVESGGNARSDIAAWCGVVMLTACALIRPVGIVLPILAAPPFALRRGPSARKIMCAAIAAMLVAAPILIWSIRNYRAVGTFTYSTEAAVNLYFYGAGGARWWRGDKPFASILAQLQNELALKDYVEAPADRETDLLRGTIEEFMKDPSSFVTVSVLSAVRTAIAPEVDGVANLAGVSQDNPSLDPFFRATGGRLWAIATRPALAIAMAVQIAIITIIWIGVAAAIPRWRKDRDPLRQAVVAFTAVAALTFLATGSIMCTTGSRLRLPALPFLVLLASYGWAARVPDRAWAQADCSRNAAAS